MIIDSIVDLGIKSNTQEWYNIRKKYVGSSELAAIAGLSKYKTRKHVLLSKLDKLQEEMTDSMAAGHIFEPIIGDTILPYFEDNVVKTYQNINENKIVRNVKKDKSTYLVNFVIDLDIVPVIVSPDYVDIDSNIPYDIKVTNPFTFKLFKESTDIHDYIWQSIMQQYVYRVDKGYLFFMVSPNTFELYSIEKEQYEPLMKNMLYSVREFYKEIEMNRDKSYEEIISTYDINDMFSIEVEPKDKEKEEIKTSEQIDELPVSLSEDIKIQYPDSKLSEILSDLSNNYIQYNEEYKVLNKKQEAIKNIIKQLFYAYQNVGKITIQYPDYKISIRLKPFKIDIF